MYQYRVRRNPGYFILEYIKLDSADWKPLMSVPSMGESVGDAAIVAAFINWVASKNA